MNCIHTALLNVLLWYESISINRYKNLSPPLPDDKILASVKLKAFADDKLNINPDKKFVFDWVEYIVGLPPFSTFSTMSSKFFSPRGRQKSSLCCTGLRYDLPIAPGAQLDVNLIIQLWTNKTDGF